MKEQRLSGLTRSSPLLQKYSAPNAEIPILKISLLSNPLVLFKRIFRG
jgi:hypothetical protein